MKGGHKLRLMKPEPERHTEICDKIIDEMRVMSREEWFKVAKSGKPGLPGFSPMRQLQLKIWDSPLTTVPQVMGVFREASGQILQRLIPWPNPGWPFAAKKKASPKGYLSTQGLTLFPYLLIDPLLDELDRNLAEFGENHPQTLATSRALCDLCLKDLERASKRR